MQTEHFDLNDIEHAPSDAQLEALMNAVAVQARLRAGAALMQRLRADIVAAKLARSPA
jgi:hypothetical protein